MTGVPAYRALKDAFPDRPLRLAAPRALAVLAPLTECVDEVVDTAGLGPLNPALHRAALAVNLHGRGPRSTAVLRAARPGRLVAFGDAVGWHPGEHEVERWCRLLRESGIPAGAAPDRLRIAPPDRVVPPRAVGATLLHPGAASGARRWPAERFAALARQELDAGREVVVTGGPAEVELVRAVAGAAGLPARALQAGSTDLAGLAALVAAAGRVVCGDTGVAHLATALGTSSVVLFGPVPPAEWGPPPDVPRHVALWAGTRGDAHAATPDPGLLRLSVSEVRQQLDALPVV